jgi:hypothetical protein
MISTDAGAEPGPEFSLYRNSSSPLAGDFIGRILFYGEDSAGNADTYAQIYATIVDPTSTQEDGRISFGVISGGTLGTAAELNSGSFTLTSISAGAVINSSSDANLMIIQGGNTASQGGQFFAYGDAHATAASDVAMFSDGVERYRWDASIPKHRFNGVTEVGDFSLTGATSGLQLTSASQRLSISTTGTSSTFMAAWYNPNGNVGAISIENSTTTYSTSSDGRKKTNKRDFDSGALIDALDAWQFDWIAGGGGFGVIAQEAQAAFPDAITEGPDGFLQADYSKFVPLLLREVKALRARLAALEA